MLATLKLHLGTQRSWAATNLILDHPPKFGGHVDPDPPRFLRLGSNQPVKVNIAASPSSLFGLREDPGQFPTVSVLIQSSPKQALMRFLTCDRQIQNQETDRNGSKEFHEFCRR